MNYKNNSTVSLFCLLLCLCGTGAVLKAQNLHLVWADEFEGSSIDPSTWQYESGPSNDNVQYYTDRVENASLVDGKLRIVALKESYQGYEYTSAHIRTEKARSWRYGRMEASIKLPATPGFVPAFWMLPLDNLYGWWPFSGEIDIMEHPTNEVTKIYGTAHTGNYNLFEGPFPPGAAQRMSQMPRVHFTSMPLSGPRKASTFLWMIKSIIHLKMTMDPQTPGPSISPFI